MGALIIAAILGTCAPLDLRVSGRAEMVAVEPSLAAPAAPQGPVWYGLVSGADGFGQPAVQASLGYEAGPLALSASLGYQLGGDPAWPRAASLALSAGRRLRNGDQLDLYLARGLNRAGGGAAVGVSLSRAFR